jgi:D-alanyl-lipoteichoic acid acyltransferase DltB (MBOAT superfamily)
MVSGLWHGAHLKFIFWGFMHALYFIPVVIYRYYSRKDFKTNRVFYPLQCLLTFLLVSLTWVFFRSRNLTQAFTYLERIFDFQPGYTHASFSIIVILFLALEFFSKDQAYPLQKVNNFKIKYLYHLLLIILIMNYGFQKVEFIYFQF